MPRTLPKKHIPFAVVVKRSSVCMFPGCGISFNDIKDLNEHTQNCHTILIDANAPHCSTCKTKGVVQNKPRAAAADIINGCCPQCRVWWCLKPGCNTECPTLSTIQKHQSEHHDRNFLDKCSQCQGLKTRAAGSQGGQCPGCNAWWCLVGDCTFDHKNSKAFRVHQTKLHKVAKLSIHGDLARCSCGVAKSGTGKHALCPNCNRYWCLVKPCFHTTTKLCDINLHINRCH